MLLYDLTWFAFRVLLLLLRGSVRTIGREKVPAQQGCLLVLNHVSVADAALVLLAFRPMEINFLIGEKWEKVPIIGWLAPRLGGIFVNRTALDREAIERTLQLLAEGKIVALAPEGMRSRIDQIIKPYHGAAYLASRNHVPIVPIGLVNTDKLFSNAKRLRPTAIEIHVGDPFVLPLVEGRVRRQSLNAYSDYIMLHIAQLLPPRYHGYYRYVGHPGLDAILRGEDPWDACLESADK